MMLARFQLGAQSYAVDCAHVIEIVPLAPLQPVPHAPEFVAGLLNFRGAAVPVIDLCMLTQRRACRTHFSSRVILIDYGALKKDRPGRVLGVMAEQVTEVCQAPAESVPPPVRVAGSPYLGHVFFLAGEMNQIIEPAELLPRDLEKILFAETVKTGQ